MKKFIILIFTLAIACGGNWRAAALVIGDRTYEALNLASTTADEMVVSKQMPPIQRQQFAKEVMVPATTALEGAIQAVITWKEGDPIPENVSRLIGILTKAIDTTAKSFGVGSQLHSNLILVRTRANGLLAQVQ